MLTLSTNPSPCNGSVPLPPLDHLWLTAILAFLYLQASLLHQIGNSLPMSVPPGPSTRPASNQALSKYLLKGWEKCQTGNPVLPFTGSLLILLCAWSQVSIMERDGEGEGDAVPYPWGVCSLEENSRQTPWAWDNWGLTDGAGHLHCTQDTLLGLAHWEGSLE